MGRTNHYHGRVSVVDTGREINMETVVGENPHWNVQYIGRVDDNRNRGMWRYN